MTKAISGWRICYSYANMLFLVVRMDQLQADHTVRRIICVQCLLRHNPNISGLGHVENGCITENGVRVLLTNVVHCNCTAKSVHILVSSYFSNLIFCSALLTLRTINTLSTVPFSIRTKDQLHCPISDRTQRLIRRLPGPQRRRCSSEMWPGSGPKWRGHPYRNCE